jgi:hypothetical protein
VEPSAETCETVKSDGEVCGRDLPCQYHDRNLLERVFLKPPTDE